MGADDDLEWHGAARPERPGGLVSSIGMNRETAPDLAVDPEASATSAIREGRRGPTALDSGPQVSVRRTGPTSDDRVRPSGRIQLPKG